MSFSEPRFLAVRRVGWCIGVEDTKTKWWGSHRVPFSSINSAPKNCPSCPVPNCCLNGGWDAVRSESGAWKWRTRPPDLEASALPPSILSVQNHDNQPQDISFVTSRIQISYPKDIYDFLGSVIVTWKYRFFLGHFTSRTELEFTTFYRTLSSWLLLERWIFIWCRS